MIDKQKSEQLKDRRDLRAALIERREQLEKKIAGIEEDIARLTRGE